MIVETSIVDLKNNLKQFKKITLDEMNSVALLKRKDTKFIINISYLPEILEALKNSYKVLEIDRKRIMNYSWPVMIAGLAGIDLYGGTMLEGPVGSIASAHAFATFEKNVDAALAECDKQKGSVANVMKAGLKKYREMTTAEGVDTEQKVAAIQKEVEEATALELPMLSKNLVFLSTITSLATLIALLGTVLGMIRSFAALGKEGGGGDASALAVGISEALYNTAIGIGTSSFAMIMYNVFTTKIDSITYGIDETSFTLTQSFATQYK